MKRAHAIVLLFSSASVLLATQADAAVIGYAYEVTRPPAFPFAAPESALGAPWVAYQLTLQTTAGELIGAVDVSITGNGLHQRWTDTDFDGITNPSPIGPASDGRGDSHLTSPAGSPFGFGPTETNSLSGSPLPSSPGTTEYGLGNLAGAWAILAPSTTANLAYIVFNQNESPSLQISVKAATPTGAPILTPRGTSTLLGMEFIAVPIGGPEPSSAMLLGMGLVGGMGFVRRGRVKNQASLIAPR